MNGARRLRDTVVRALAKVGLVWAVVVLGALFMAMSAQAQQHHEDARALTSAGTQAHDAAVSVTSGDRPRTAGLALALVILGGGVTVLAIGASRGDRQAARQAVRRYAAEPEPAEELSLALSLCA